ncbi:MAG: permease-like cell division protein FtsX [Patescibacteria group bacterium]
MLWINIKRIWRSGLASFWRGGVVSFAPVIIMTSTLFVIGALLFLGASFNHLLGTLKDKVDITVYFVPEATETDILEMQSKIEKLPEVARVEYISKEEALENFKMQHADDELILQSLEVIGRNPLGANINIKAKEISQLESISKFFDTDSAISSSGVSIIDSVNYHRNKEVIDRLTKIINAIDTLSFFTILLFVVLSIVITFNTITLAIYSAKEEIGVMRLVGASDRHVRGPFVVQGAIMGGIAGVLVMIIFYPLTLWLGPITEFAFSGLNVFDYYVSNFFQFFLILLSSGVVLGAFSSYLSVRKYIKF